MKNQKIIIVVSLCLSIVLPLLLFSIMFPNMYNPTKLTTSSSAAEFAEDLEQKVPSLMKKYNLFGGVAIGIISDYELTNVILDGYANEAENTPIANTTYFQIASMSKPFCAWGVMSLYEDGLIDIDDSIDSYLTRWNLPSSKFNNREVTIRRVLSHTAGLSLESFMGYPTNEDIPTIEEVLEANVKVIAEPGTQWMYSGGGFLVLQLLIEKVSGQSYSDYIMNEILLPLNLSHSRPDWTMDIQNSSAFPYNPSGDKLPMYRFTALAAGGHYSTILDLSNFILANMEGPIGESAGRGVLNESTIALMQTQVAEVHPFMGGYGLGFQIKQLENHQKMVYHNGQNTGFISTMNFIPETGEGLVILTSCDSAKSFVVEIESKWQAMNQGTLKNTLFYSKILIMLPILSVFLLTLVSVSIWITLSITKNKRQLTYQKNTSRFITASILGVVLVITLVFLYTPIRYRSGFIFVYWFLNFIHWIALVACISLLYFAVIALTYYKKK
jgi:CubicO group peptidase (beta-lactamase class C family)